MTALHLLDWTYEEENKKNELKSALRKTNIELKILNHLANGAKHMILDDRHKSVLKSEKKKYASEDYFAENYTEEPLVIHLDGEAAKKLSSKIAAIDLADCVMEIYKKELSERNLIH